MTAWGPRCSTRRRLILLAVAVYILAVAVRAVVCYEARDWPTFTHPQIDEYTAHQIGLAFLDGNTPREVYLKGPLYMVFVAGVAKLFGHDPLAVRWVQVFLSGLTPVLIFLASERLFGWRTGLLAGAMTAMFWTIVYYSLAIVDAALTSVLYALFLYLLVAIDGRRRWKWPLCGAVMALGALSRPSVLAFAPVLAVMVLVTTWRARTARTTDAPGGDAARTGLLLALVNVLMLTLGCLAVIAPVTIRNRVVGGEWVLIGAYGGQNLWIANSPRSDGKNVPIYVGEGVPKVSPVDPNDVWTQISLGNRIARYYAERAEGRTLRFGEIDAYFAKIAIDYIVENPGAFLAKSFKRFCFFLNAYEYPNERDIYWFAESSRLLTALSWVHFGLLCPVAAMGVIFVIARRSWTAPMAYTVGMLAMLWLPGLFFVINARFRVVVVVLMVPFAAYGLMRLAGLCRRGEAWSARILCLAGLAGLGVVSNVNLFGYREDHYTDLRLGFAVACADADRKDLLPDAVERVRRAILQDVESGRLAQTAIMEHARPFGWLFFYYFCNGQLDAALDFGRLMMEREPHDALRTAAFFDVAIGENRKKEAAEALDILTSGRIVAHPMEVALRLIRFGQTYSDTASLVEAERRLELLTNQMPAEPRFRGALEHVRGLLKDGPRTRPSTRALTTRPG